MMASGQVGNQNRSNCFRLGQTQTVLLRMVIIQRAGMIELGRAKSPVGNARFLPEEQEEGYGEGVKSVGNSVSDAGLREAES